MQKNEKRLAMAMLAIETLNLLANLLTALHLMG